MYLARLTPNQLCSPSNKLHWPEKRLEKLLIGVGVFSRLRAKSASVKLCCRSRVPKTYTGPLPRTALSVNKIFGISGERASRIAAAEMRVSASAALCSGFFASARLTASGKVSGVPVCAAPVCAAKDAANSVIAASVASFISACPALVPKRDGILCPDQGSFGHRHNLKRGVQFGGRLDHGAHRAVLLFRQLDRVFQRLRRNFDPLTMW